MKQKLHIILWQKKENVLRWNATYDQETKEDDWKCHRSDYRVSGLLTQGRYHLYLSNLSYGWELENNMYSIKSFATCTQQPHVLLYFNTSFTANGGGHLS